MGIDPVKLKPTWRNNRSGDARVAKRIDHFLAAEQLVDRFFMVRQWVGSGGSSDHFPIFFEIKKGPINPPSPLKFNKSWLQDETFKTLFLSHWNPFEGANDRSAAIQFADNIKTLKVHIKEWSIAKRNRDDAEFKTIEAELLLIYEGEGGGFSTIDSKEALTRLEGRRNTLLLEKEEAWRLKSRAIWLNVGMITPNFFTPMLEEGRWQILFGVYRMRRVFM